MRGKVEESEMTHFSGQGPPNPSFGQSPKNSSFFLGKTSVTFKGKIKASISQVLAPLLRERKLLLPALRARSAIAW